jgi:hypothetical protein
MKMTCAETRERIIEWLLDTVPEATSREVSDHCAACQDCSLFFARHHALDERLEKLLIPVEPDPRLRRTVVRRVAVTSQNRWPDALPELVHFISWGVAIAAGTQLLPISAAMTAVGGVVLAISSYFALAVARTSFEATAN